MNSNLSSVNTKMNVVTGCSMEPALYRGDIVTVEKNPDNVNIGDIVIYNATWFGQPVIHRIINITKTLEGDVYLMKGDNNPFPTLSWLKGSRSFQKLKWKMMVLLLYLK